MKMINVSREGDKYLIKTINSIKIFGHDIISWTKLYARDSENKEWYEIPSRKSPNEEKRVKLDRWLKSHQKFIEKSKSH